MFCRAKYILLPNYLERRKWLAREVSLMRKSADGHCQFKIDLLGNEYRRCCGNAWRLAYGVSRITFLRQLKGTPVTVGSKKKFSIPHTIPNPTDCHIAAFTDTEIQFVEWLKKCAEGVACKLPFGEGAETQLRLPYPSKKTVHHLYNNFQKFDNYNFLTFLSTLLSSMENLPRFVTHQNDEAQRRIFQV